MQQQHQRITNKAERAAPRGPHEECQKLIARFQIAPYPFKTENQEAIAALARNILSLLKYHRDAEIKNGAPPEKAAPT